MRKNILILMMLLLIPNLNGDEIMEKALTFSGIEVIAINTVIEDYFKNKEGDLSNLYYYKFDLNKDKNDNLIVSLYLDVKLLLSENKQLCKGGGAKYILNNKNGQIIKKMLFK